MKLLSLLSIALLTTACVPTQEVAETTSGKINRDAPYLWGDASFPKTLRVSKEFDAAEVQNIESMATAWSQALDNKKNFFIFGETTPEITNSLNNMDSLYESTPILGIYKSTSWPPSLKATAPFALAVTQLFGYRHNTGKSNEFVAIEHADILVNYDTFSFSTGDSVSAYDLRTVILHELGHFLGLQHRDLHWSRKDDSVMYPSISTGEAKRYPRDLDITDLADKYGISLGGGGANNYAVAPRQIYKADPREVGQEIKILLELHADGNCVHRVNGEIVKTHPVEMDQFKK